MFLSDGYKPEYESFRDLLESMAEETSPEALAAMIVKRMASRPHVALACVWFLRPPDLCSECDQASIDSNRSQCLHLVASAGRSDAGENAGWASLNGPHRRISLNAPEFCEVARIGRALRIHDLCDNSEWLARNSWARGEAIQSATYCPLMFRNEYLGVLGIYLRIDSRRSPEAPFWTMMTAHQLATSIANTRAFQQVEQLRAQLELENSYLREEVVDAGVFGDIVGSSPPMTNLLERVNLVAPTDATVLITGESGTGKELLAREIHQRSLRRDRPMIKVNCAAVPAELYESEFFGHAKGAFTGAVADRAGRFRAADEGTLFLDEVGEIPLGLQSKLLRVLQEGTYERVGEEVTRHADVRIIAASNRDLKTEIEAGRFRKDLYYRLNVFPIEVVPLRQRKEDILSLAKHFLQVISVKMKRPMLPFTPADVAKLQAYDWPGNVRELQNLLERAVIISRSGRLQLDLPSGRSPHRAISAVPAPPASWPEPQEVLREDEVRERIRNNIVLALHHCQGKIYGSNGAAALLKVSPTTLISRMQRLNLSFRKRGEEA